MRAERSRTHRVRRLLAVVALSVWAGGCGTGDPNGGTPPPASPVVPAGSGSIGVAPPDAILTVEGGDPVVGQLGTYVWGDGGSDAPWLPGAAMVVAAGEPIGLTLEPSAGIASWRARYIPSGADASAQAIRLGEGGGIVTFGAPGTGDWSVRIEVEFADGLGSAAYYWRLDVR